MEIKQNTMLSIPDEEYFNAKYINFSTLKQFLISPKHYKCARESQVTHDTPALRFGSALHCAVLTPEAFKEKYEVALEQSEPLADRKKQKAWAEENKKILYQPSEIMPLVDAINNDPVASSIITNAVTEQSIFFGDCKAKIDGYNAEKKILFDVKTTTSADPRKFSYSVCEYKYHVQASHYLEALKACGLEVLEYNIIAVEKTPPYDVVVFQLDQIALEVGANERNIALDGIRSCVEFDSWQGIARGEKITISLPKWAL